jgi:hypothetical protein
MSISRLFSVFVALALVVVVVLTVQAGIATSKVVSSPQVALDQHERHPAFVNPSAVSAAVAEQARLEYRRGEWNAGGNAPAAEFDVEQARIGWRAGK